MRPPWPADPPADVPPQWRQLVDRLPDDACVLIIGPTDVGKSTLCWWLAGELCKRAGAPDGNCSSVAVVDADIGQSRIGPPACVGWQTLGADDLQFYFVGAVSPERRPSSAFKATVAACDAAREAARASLARCVVVDTTGYLTGDLARTLKSAKIKRLRPVHVIAIGDDPALDAILAPWSADPGVTIYRVPRSSAARGKSQEQRSRWRRDGFARWLTGANLRWIESQGREFLHAPAQEVFGRSASHAAQLKGLLLGFSDVNSRGTCLGLLHSMDWQNNRVLALCPDEAEAATIVDFGCLKLEPDGAQKS